LKKFLIKQRVIKGRIAEIKITLKNTTSWKVKLALKKQLHRLRKTFLRITKKEDTLERELSKSFLINLKKSD